MRLGTFIAVTLFELALLWSGLTVKESLIVLAPVCDVVSVSGPLARAVAARTNAEFNTELDNHLAKGAGLSIREELHLRRRAPADAMAGRFAHPPLRWVPLCRVWTFRR